MLKTFSTLAYLVMVAGLVGLLYRRALLATSLPGWVLQGGAVGMLLWARITFGRRSFHLAANPTEGGLVTTGPYRYIRHPIYTSVCLFVWCGVASHFSLGTILLGLVVQAGAVARVLCEEALIPSRYPEYREYSLRTWRMVPLIF